MTSFRYLSRSVDSRITRTLSGNERVNYIQTRGKFKAKISENKRYGNNRHKISRWKSEKNPFNPIGDATRDSIIASRTRGTIAFSSNIRHNCVSKSNNAEHLATLLAGSSVVERMKGRWPWSTQWRAIDAVKTNKRERVPKIPNVLSDKHVEYSPIISLLFF